MGTTSIRVDETTVDELYALKQRGDSYDDVITRLLDDQTHRSPSKGPEKEAESA